MEIFPNLHWLEAGYANVYLLVEEDGVTLVDSGPPGREGAILHYVRDQLQRETETVRRILITHADWDHAGSAAALQEATGATVVAGRRTAGWLRQGQGPPHMPRPVQFFLDRVIRFDPIPPERLEVVDEDEVLAFGGGLHVLYTPGHTMDHYAFFAPESGILFAGDALGTRSGRLGLSGSFITADEEAARRSARRLLALTPALFACGHGEPLQERDRRDLTEDVPELR